MLFTLSCALLVVFSFSQKTYCTRSLPCWPSNKEIKALYDSLGPTLSRNLTQKQGQPIRFPSIKNGSQQPLNGLGLNMEPLYVANASESLASCFRSQAAIENSKFCTMASRNLPSGYVNPAIVAWPLTASHVQKLVQFAKAHNICIMVAATGLDQLNRHSCAGVDGLFIRTTLLKSISWDLRDSRGFGHSAGNVRLGAGIVFAEVGASAAENNRVVASPWDSTALGVVGWSIGGGHGPMTPSLGLGVDNILEVEMVLPSGVIATLNNKPFNMFRDLFWALKGGGGSTWGVITSITIKAHPIPIGGFSKVSLLWKGNKCGSRDEGSTDSFTEKELGLIVQIWQHFSYVASSKWSGFLSYSPVSTGELQSLNGCGGIWDLKVGYWYQGNVTDSEYTNFLRIHLWNPLWNALQDTPTTSDYNDYRLYTNFMEQNFADWYKYVQTQETCSIDPNVGGDEFVKGVPSSLLTRKSMVTKEQIFRNTILRLRAGTITVYQDLTGNIDSPAFSDKVVSISSYFRNATYLTELDDILTVNEDVGDLQLLSNWSTFAESSYKENGLVNFTSSYWGDKYETLVAIKNKYDPSNIFGCYKCVSADATKDPYKSNLLISLLIRNL